MACIWQPSCVSCLEPPTSGPSRPCVLHALLFACALTPRSTEAFSSAVAQYAARAGCYEQIVQHEARRQMKYKHYVRARFDMLLLQPVPLAFLDRLQTDCTAIVPDGEDYGGLNDRLLFGDGCAFAKDASIMEEMARLDGQHIVEGWNPERANAHNLASLGERLHRMPLAACLLTVEGACKLRGELVQSERLLPTLLNERPHLCGSLLVAGNDKSTCDPARSTIQDDAMRVDDPGYCSLERRCVNTSVPAAICLPDGGVVEDGNLLVATTPCSWELPTVWWRGAGHRTPSCAASNLISLIRKGELTPRDLQLVVVRGHGEDVAWSEPFSAVRTLAPGSKLGREQAAYLRHLISHYDNLPDRLVFVHARGTLQKTPNRLLKCLPRRMAFV